MKPTDQQPEPDTAAQADAQFESDEFIQWIIAQALAQKEAAETEEVPPWLR